MVDNSTEVISLGGEHGAVYMKTFNRQYTIQTQSIISKNFLLLRMLSFKCSVHTKLFVKLTFCQLLTWGTRPKGKRGLSSRTTYIPLFFNTILGVCV